MTTTIKYHCENCGVCTGTPKPLIRMDLDRDVALERFSPGDYLPTGECEHCGALAYDDSLWKEITRKEASSDLLKALESLTCIVSRLAPSLEGMMEFKFSKQAISKAKGQPCP